MSLRWRTISIALLLLLFGSLTAANFVSKEQRIASAILPDDLLRLGLDLQGGPGIFRGREALWRNIVEIL